MRKRCSTPRRLPSRTRVIHDHVEQMITVRLFDTASSSQAGAGAAVRLLPPDTSGRHPPGAHRQAPLLHVQARLRSCQGAASSGCFCSTAHCRQHRQADKQGRCLTPEVLPYGGLSRCRVYYDATERPEEAWAEASDGSCRWRQTGSEVKVIALRVGAVFSSASHTLASCAHSKSHCSGDGWNREMHYTYQGM